GSNDAQTMAQIEAAVVANPGRRFVIDFSAGPEQCDARVYADLESADAAQRAEARATCARADSEFYRAYNEGFVKNLGEYTRGRALWINAAANVDVPLANSGSMSSCTFIPVGGLDQVSGAPTLAPFTEVSSAFPVYAPACNVTPITLGIAPVSGNSFAAA